MTRSPLAAIAVLLLLSPAGAREPIPDKLVVLTFDDSAKSHYTVARPILTKYKFGATFFITEGFDFPTNKKDYMTWEEIAQLHKDGFEIGNHTLDHKAVTDKALADLPAQLRGINAQCKKHGIPRPTSFAYPGNAISKDGLAVLKENGITFARRGGAPEFPYKEGRGFAYEPGLDHALLIPSAGDARPAWALDEFKAAVAQAKHGKIAVLQFHGVPDTAHDWVNSTKEQFESYMKHLTDNKFTVNAMRDLAKFVDPNVNPSDPFFVIEDRKKLLEAKRDGANVRPAKTDAELKYWLDNALAHHRYTHAEAGAAFGISADEVATAAKRLGIDPSKRPQHNDGDPLPVLPYPGGRHPRIGFRDGMVRPQRETKASVFAPWDDGGYAVADTPEAVWFDVNGRPELLYLAHTHVPTTWDKKKVALDPMEWTRKTDGSLALERTLPNKVTLATFVTPGKGGVRMEFRVTNGTAEKLTGLRVQMCVMLAGLTGFDERTNANKVFASPFAACKDATGKRWVITGWERCGRAWGNAPCPCVHADPVVEDCPAAQTRTVRGWLSFYEGDNIDAELKRLKDVAFPAK
ncbi:MAG: polysaccharide deacetylase family protein [Planctomycetes bacterium]|nr:polysaccharide deacetylase family protein [Planctomycetota bacterium]